MGRTPRVHGVRRLSAFVLVGIVGFAVDATVLSALVYGLSFSHYSARAVSFGTAVTVTWYLNRRWTFSSTNAAAREYRGYVLTQLVGAIINLGTYAAIIELSPALARWPVLPLAAGAALALAFNYTTARYVFRRGAPGTSQR